MKYLIVGQNGHGEPIYRRRKNRYGEWTYYRPDARRYGSREEADLALKVYSRKHGRGLRFVVPVTIDVVFRHEFGRIVFRGRSSLVGTSRG